jgi:TcpE family
MALDLATYTTVWELERKLYAIDDIPLRRGIPYDKLLIYACILVPWWALLKWLGVPFERGVPSVLYLVVPVAATYLLTKAKVHGKPLLVWLWSQLRYLLLEPRAWHRLTSVRGPMPVAFVVEAVCWRPQLAPTRSQRTPPRHAAARGTALLRAQPAPPRRRRPAVVRMLLLGWRLREKKPRQTSPPAALPGPPTPRHSGWSAQ